MTSEEAIELIEEMLQDERKRWSWADTQLNSIYSYIEDHGRATEKQINALKNIRASVAVDP